MADVSLPLINRRRNIFGTRIRRGMTSPEDQLRIMIDKIPTLAWACRPDGTAEFLNQRWHEYTGLSTEEALGWGWKIPIHPEDSEALMETWIGMIDSGQSGQHEA